MAYQSKINLSELDGSDSFKNGKGDHQCVTLVQMVSSAPNTAHWKRGKRVMETKPGEILRGTVIATFDVEGKYPLTARHAAIYINHDDSGILVLDQWVKQGKAKQRRIRLKNLPERDVNDAKYYLNVE